VKLIAWWMSLTVRWARAQRRFRAAHPAITVINEVAVFTIAAGLLSEWPSLGTWLLILWPPFWHFPAAARIFALLIFAMASAWGIATTPKPED
jgi:hypothetical protein